MPTPPPLEFFPVDISDYRYHQPLHTAEEVEAVTAALAAFAPCPRPWKVIGSERTADAVQERLSEWATPSSNGNTFLYWISHGESDGEDMALLAHAGSPHPLIHSGISPDDFFRYLTARQNHPDAEGTWAIVVIDACKSGRFVELLSARAFLKSNGPRNFLLVSTSEDGTANLGVFRHALETVLGTTFAADSTIDLRALGDELQRNLRGCPVVPHTKMGRALLHRIVPAAAGAVTTTLDVLAEIQAVIDQLPPDEQRHFIPKATGAELGELAWYFEGRQEERDTILRWLDTGADGMLVVTGTAGSGKSALLGHILLHTRPKLRSILLRTGHLQPLPSGVPCPSDPFDAVIHLSGATPQELIARLALAAQLREIPRDLLLNEQIEWLLDGLAQRALPFGVLLDALDEAHAPLVIADQIVRRLAEVPGTRVVIGTRRSTKEGPDLPPQVDRDLLDALDMNGADSDLAKSVVSVNRDSLAMARYVRRKLETAEELGRLTASSQQIAMAASELGDSGREFLYARLAVHEVIHDSDLLDDLTSLRNSSHRQLFARAAHRLSTRNPAFRPLLHALALAQGRGLPLRDGIWATVAAVVAPMGATINDEVIHDLTADAAPYLMLDAEAGQTVYRLAHRTFIEHFNSTGEKHEHLHQQITESLTVDGDFRLPKAELNPYVIYHLPAHAAQGQLPAWEYLAQHTRVLDRLDSTSITSQVMTHAFGRITLPPAIAGAVASQHMAVTNSQGDRRGLREVATAQTTGSFDRSHGEPDDTLPTWSVTWARLNTNPLHLTLRGHTRGVRAVVAFLMPDGRTLLAAGGDDGAVRIWDPLTGTAFGEPLRGHIGGVFAVVAFPAPDGRTLLATGGNDGLVRIWDPVTGTEVGEPLRGHTRGVRGVAAFPAPAPDGRTLLATGGNDGTVRIWDPVTGTEVGEPLRGHTRGVRGVAAFPAPAPDGRTLLATGGNDGTVRIWDPLTGTEVGEPLRGHTGGVRAVVAFPALDGRTLLATGSDDGLVRIWDPVTGTEVGEPLRGHTGGVRAVVAFPALAGRTLIATGGIDGTVRIWDPLTRTVGEPGSGYVGEVGAVVAFPAPDGRTLLATGGNNGTVRIWDSATGISGSTPLRVHSGGVVVVAVFPAPDGHTLIATGGGDGLVRIWDPVTGAAFGEPLPGHVDGVFAVVVFPAPDGRTLLATGGLDGMVRIGDPLTGTMVGEPLPGHVGGVFAVVAFPALDDRTLLAAGCGDGMVRIWDPLTGTMVGEPLPSHRDEVFAMVAFPAPDGRTLLATGGGDGAVRIWDPVTGAEVGEPLPGQSGAVVAAVAFLAADGRTLLATSSNGIVRIWDLETSTSSVLPLTVHVLGLASVDGSLALVGPDGALMTRWHGGSDPST